MTAIKSPFGISVNQSALTLISQLAAPEGAEVQTVIKYSDVLKADPDGMVQIGTHRVEHSAVAGSLDDFVKAPKGAVKSLLSTADRLKVIEENIQKQTDRINTAIEKGARKAILKSPAGKSQLKYSELADLVRDTQVFNNPLNIPSSVHKINNPSGVWYQVRLAASAVTKVVSGESVVDATERLLSSVVNDRENLIALGGLKLTDKNLSLVGHATRAYKQPLPEGTVGVVIGYSLTFDDVSKATRVVTKLHEASLSGVVHVLNAATTDGDTLRLNLNAGDILAELEAETAQVEAEPAEPTPEPEAAPSVPDELVGDTGDLV